MSPPSHTSADSRETANTCHTPQEEKLPKQLPSAKAGVGILLPLAPGWVAGRMPSLVQAPPCAWERKPGSGSAQDVGE